MNICTYFLLACAFAITSGTENASAPTAGDYLNQQLKEFKVDIVKRYSQDPLPPVGTYDVHWNRLWNNSLKSDHALALSFSDETFVIANERILRVEVEVSENVMLREVALISREKAAKFIRNTAWKGSLYLLICQEDGSCNLYAGPNMNNLHHRQIVKHLGLPMDAEFFVNGNQLYLVVADSTGQFPVPSVIYRWTGTYMDIVAKVTTTGAVSVTTFGHKYSTIIIFAQNVQGEPNIGSEVFKFRNGVVEKIQFLATDGPTSIHHYKYNGKIFLLVISELSTSRVFWWDDKEFLNWMELPEIKSPTKVKIVYVDGDTLLLVSEQNTLSLYKIMNLAYIKLNLLHKEKRHVITDFNARVNGSSIVLVVITKAGGNVYRIEPVELRIKKYIQVVPTEVPEDTLLHLTQLDEILRNRMPEIENAHESWASLLPFSENVILSSPLEFEHIIVNSGHLSNLLLFSRVEILSPTELADSLAQLNLAADLLLSQSSDFLLTNQTAELRGRVIIERDGFLDGIHVDFLNVTFLNGQRLDLNSVLSYAADQDFSDALRGHNVIIENLEIESLCGIPFRNWQRRQDAEQVTLNLLSDYVQVLNDTVYIQSDLSLDNLGVVRLNNLDLNSFVTDLFIIGWNQEISGSIFYKRELSVHHLVVNSTNGVSAMELLTKTTDQQLGDISLRSLEIDDLSVGKINNVSVNEFARISQENLISGQVIFQNLRITEELSIEGVSVLSDLRPIQIYNDVEIHGDLTIRSLNFPSAGSSIYLNDSKVELNSLFTNYWTKSTDQTIIRNITLARGITIDDLRATYLNGLQEDDFLYTTATEIPEKFGTLHFKDFETDGRILVEGKEFPAESKDMEDGLLVNQKIWITDFRVDNLNAYAYNNIPIEDIIGNKINVKVPGTVKYENLIVTNDFKVGKLLFKFLNNRDTTSFFEQALYVNESYVIDSLQAVKVETFNFQVEEIGGLKMIDFYRMLQYKDVIAIKNVTVNGDLQVNGNIKVDFINDISSGDFMAKLSYGDIELRGQQIFENFIVFGNLSTNLLHGQRLVDLATSALSKTKPQRITGRFSFQKVQSNQLSFRTINSINATNLKLVSEPIIVEGDVTFTDLLVQGDIITGSLNGLDIAEIYDKALLIPFGRIANLTVNGSIIWEDSISGLESVSYLYIHAVTRNTNQTITGNISFVDNVCAFRLTRKIPIGDVDVSGIVSDAVVPGQPVHIEGRKILAKGFTVGCLTVSGDIGIPVINGSNILELNSTMVRKFHTQTITGLTIFSKDVTIEQLEVTGNVHGLPTHGIITHTDMLPNNTIFENLVVENELHITKLDEIDFDGFVKNRITLNGNHEIYQDVFFNHSVSVTQNAVQYSTNGIEMSDIVLTGTETMQLIVGEKVFLHDLTIHGHMDIDTINDINVTNEYQNGIFNNEDVYIVGNIIFSADFETLSNVSVFGLVNSVKLDESFINTSLVEADMIIENLERNQSSVDAMIQRSFNTSQLLPDMFFYFDIQAGLEIRVPNIRKVQSLEVELMTRLNLYSTEDGRHCGLPDFCPCPVQYVAELLDSNSKIWRVSGQCAVYNFHDPEGRYDVDVFSNITSSSIHCTQKDPGSEFITISWISPSALTTGQNAVGQMKNSSLNISGYLSDVKTFTIGAKLYVVLAIYYVSSLRSHNVNSLVYEIDLANGQIRLAQAILTSKATALDVFATPLHGLHLLIACAGNHPAESELYRFNMQDSKFELLRSFRTGGSRNAKSLVQGQEFFVLLDDPLANSVHIFNYKSEYDNYHFYQSLYHQSPVYNIDIFYAGEFGASDAFVIVTTEEGRFFVYEYMFYGGFQLRIQQWLDGVQTMVPFNFSQRRYIFAGTIANSTVYRIVQQGPNYS